LSKGRENAWPQVEQDLGEALKAVSGLDGILETASGLDDALSGSVSVLPALSNLERSLAKALPRIQVLRDELEGKAREQAATFCQRLSSYLKDKGHEVFGESSPIIVDGVVHVEAEPSKGRLNINDEPLATFSLQSIAQRVAEERERLERLATPPERLLEQLSTAYDREVKASGKQPGAQVEVGSVLAQLVLLRQPASFRTNPRAKNYREYPRELFRADLYALMQSEVNTVQGRAFRYSSGSSPTGAIYVFVPAKGRAVHLGRVWFEEAGESNGRSQEPA
jgi:hypothetical protein